MKKIFRKKVYSNIKCHEKLILESNFHLMIISSINKIKVKKILIKIIKLMKIKNKKI
jgi:hypothetical protein